MNDNLLKALVADNTTTSPTGFRIMGGPWCSGTNNSRSRHLTLL